MQLYEPLPSPSGGDMVSAALQTVKLALSYTRKPVLLSEFSLNRWTAPLEDDPTGVHIRNTIWVAALTGAAGGAMPWWWDSYVEAEDLYDWFIPLARFAQAMPWTSPDFQPVPVALIASDTQTYNAVRLEDFNRDFDSLSPPDTVYHITGDGTFPASARFSGYLYGWQNPELSYPQTFVVVPPVDTELTVGVLNVSPDAPAILSIQIDGAEVARVDFSPGNANLLIAVPITAGEHTVVLDDVGPGWLQLAHVGLNDYRTVGRVLALADRVQGVAAVWIHHRGYSWATVAQGSTITPQDYRLRIAGMPPGIYRVSYWNTATGAVIGDERVTLPIDSDGTLRLNLLPLTDQFAIQAVRIAGAAARAYANRGLTRTPRASLTPTATSTATPSRHHHTMRDAECHTQPDVTDTATMTATYTSHPNAEARRRQSTPSPTATTEPIRQRHRDAFTHANSDRGSPRPRPHPDAKPRRATPAPTRTPGSHALHPVRHHRARPAGPLGAD